MKIAVLGWGSLIWNPGSLNISEEGWVSNGPRFPLDYARISNGNRLTLVIKPEFDLVQTLYAVSAYDTLEGARNNLQEREETPAIENIGFYDFTTGEKSVRREVDQISRELEIWHSSNDFDAVIWTDLGPNFSDKRKKPFNLEQICAFLNSLSEDEYASAKEYILNTPPQIRTRFRSGIEDYISNTRR